MNRNALSVLRLTQDLKQIQAEEEALERRRCHAKEELQRTLDRLGLFSSGNGMSRSPVTFEGVVCKIVDIGPAYMESIYVTVEINDLIVTSFSIRRDDVKVGDRVKAEALLHTIEDKFEKGWRDLKPKVTCGDAQVLEIRK